MLLWLLLLSPLLIFCLLLLAAAAACLPCSIASMWIDAAFLLAVLHCGFALSSICRWRSIGRTCSSKPLCSCGCFSGSVCSCRAFASWCDCVAVVLRPCPANEQGQHQRSRLPRAVTCTRSCVAGSVDEPLRLCGLNAIGCLFFHFSAVLTALTHAPVARAGDNAPC